MTSKEAIERLNYIKEHQIDPEDYVVFDRAIRAMEALESIDFNIYALGKLMEDYKNEAN